jgi:hypothetical protein
VFEGDQRRGERAGDEGFGVDHDGDPFENLRLGHEIRFVLVGVGGGGIRVAAEVARRRLPYLESVAINCDPRVQDLEEFDRRICLGPENGGEPDTGGSAVVGGHLARAAEPTLERIFDGATFVTIVASLGGGTGTGALPYVLEAASHAAAALKVFVVKPFECEADRRAVAERAIARIHFIDPFVEKQLEHRASLRILDNETLAREHRTLPVNRIDRFWGEIVATQIEEEIIRPAESTFEAERRASIARAGLLMAPPPVDTGGAVRAPEPLLPIAPHMDAPGPDGAPPLAELTFEVLSEPNEGPRS